MDRRHYLTTVGIALLAGCPDGGSTETSTPTETATETDTATPTTDRAPTATETDTETETATETETLSGREQARAALRDAREGIQRAHELYLDLGDAESLTGVGPATTGFDDSEIQTELDAARERIDTAMETARDEQESTADMLRVVIDWLSTAAALQAAMSDVVGQLEALGTAAAERQDYAEVYPPIEEAIAAIATVGDVRTRLSRPNMQAVHAFDGIDGDEVTQKQQALHGQAVGFGNLQSPLEVVRREVGRLEDAEAAIDEEEEDDAEQLAERAIGFLGDAKESASNRAPGRVATVFNASVDELIAIAEEIADRAQAM
jgi:hypothetical protein